jgi:hypothetical protein
MASWQKRSSSQAAPRTDRRWHALLPVCALLAGGCGHAGDGTPPADSLPAVQPDSPAVAATSTAGASAALCIPAPIGSVRARLQGAIDAELDWGSGMPQCQGGVRPQGDGLRLIYKGSDPEAGPLLLVLGIAPLRPGESARNVPVNVTVVREGTGQFFATQGEDKCALDAVTQVPLAGQAGFYRLEGRGYCTQPARAIAGDGAVLLSRFDVVAIVPAAADQTRTGGHATEATQ